jgi:hypothetical protein
LLAELILGVCLIVVLVFHIVCSFRWSEERRMLVNSLRSSSPSELTVLQKATEPLPITDRLAKADPGVKTPTLPFGL